MHSTAAYGNLFRIISLAFHPPRKFAASPRKLLYYDHDKLANSLAELDRQALSACLINGPTSWLMPERHGQQSLRAKCAVLCRAIRLTG